jgi:hypothetical protein
MNIEFPESYPMAGGDGAHSYAQNSKYQVLFFSFLYTWFFFFFFFNICTVVFPILSVHLPLARKKHMPING